jgi:MFS family permease
LQYRGGTAIMPRTQLTNSPTPSSPLAVRSQAEIPAALPGARPALVLLLLINLFNYIDRYVLAAVEPNIAKDFFGTSESAETLAKMGSLATAFLISYMVTAPIFGWLADRMSRWLLVGVSVLLWSLATGASGLAATFGLLLITRLFVGVGEAGYGPAAPTIISDLYPVSRRGAVLAWFYMAIPVGSALGFAIGGMVGAHLGWRWAFYIVTVPGILLGIWCFFMTEPPRGTADAAVGAQRKAGMSDYLALARIPSYTINTAAMAAMTFAIGGISFWMPRYLTQVRGLSDNSKTIFGGVTVVAGLAATLLGGLAGDKLRPRFPGSYFLVSGCGIIAACPFIILMLYTPFPVAWVWLFCAVFFLFFNTGPSNTALANVTHPSVRATAFALNIFMIHAIGDAPAPPLLGAIAGKFGWNMTFFVVAAAMALAGVLWLWGMKHLAADTAAAPTSLS